VRLLLDTHALLWWLADEDRLGTRARELIEDPDTEILDQRGIFVGHRTVRRQAGQVWLARAAPPTPIQQSLRPASGAPFHRLAVLIAALTGVGRLQAGQL
jgi:hypothetical protein